MALSWSSSHQRLGSCGGRCNLRPHSRRPGISGETAPACRPTDFQACLCLWGGLQDRFCLQPGETHGAVVLLPVSWLSITCMGPERHPAFHCPTDHNICYFRSWEAGPAAHVLCHQWSSRSTNICTLWFISGHGKRVRRLFIPQLTLWLGKDMAVLQLLM